MDITLAGLTQFLKAFGYFDHNANISDSLAAYQRYNGLPITGEPDEATIAHMCQRRCRHADNPGRASVTSKWQKRDLTWKFLNYTLDIPQHEISDSINKAFALWSAVVPLNFQEVLAAEQADITIEFKVLDSPGQVLAQAWFPPVGTLQADDSEAWSWKLPIGRGQVDLTTVVCHEAGHLIGLDHSSVQGAQMAPVYNGPMRFLAADDIRRAQALYGSR